MANPAPTRGGARSPGWRSFHAEPRRKREEPRKGGDGLRVGRRRRLFTGDDFRGPVPPSTEAVKLFLFAVGRPRSPVAAAIEDYESRVKRYFTFDVGDVKEEGFRRAGDA